MHEELYSLLRKLVFGIAVVLAVYFVYQTKLAAHVYVDQAELVNVPRITGADPEWPSQVARDVGRTFRVGDFTARTLAEYDIHGIMVKKAHSNYDAIASVTWLDIGIAYGAYLKNPAMLRHVRFMENDRVLWARPDREFERQFESQLSHYSNNHLIFSTKALEAAAEKVAEGQRIRLRGYLVTIGNGKIDAASSMTRDDFGCEMIFVTDVKTYD